MHTTFSNSLTNNTSIGSTKGFFSFSSQSVFENQKGPGFFERFKSNLLHLSANIHRYSGLDETYHNFSMIFRLLQTFCLNLIPRCKIFWNMNSTTSFFIYLLELPLHLCIIPGNSDFHCYFLIIIFLFFLISIIFIFVIILRDPNEHSISNSVIFYISLYFSVLTPILSVFIFSLFGFCLNDYIFNESHHPQTIVAIVSGVLGIILSVFSHYLSFYVMRGTAVINFSMLFIPWAPYITIYANYELYNYFLSFLGEFLPVEEKMYQIIFSVFALIGSNPFTIIYMFVNPVFQDLNDTIYLSTIMTVNMISMILMDFRFLSSKLTPALLFVVVIISFVICLILYTFIIRRIIMKYSKKIFSIYKHTKPLLPPTTPLVFQMPVPNQTLLSHDAYSVMQAFSSLEISTVREYHYYMLIGAYMKIPAVKNLDFIKWGLNYFHDTKSLVICAQICQYFNDNSQIQAVLTQKLNEYTDVSFFMTPIIFNLVLYHADVISDKPAFLKKLQKKAFNGVFRCRRAMGNFWGCVLKHSPTSMEESLCKLRDTIAETRIHFDELNRCYPFSLESISMYLNFMTEICGEYVKCNKYINKMSSKFIEMKSDAIENDDSINTISALLSDQTKNFSPYLAKLAQYLDIETRTSKTSFGPSVAIWSLAIASGLVFIICILVIMVYTLVSFNDYPCLLKIVNSADDVFIEIASLILGVRRICMFSSGDLKTDEQSVCGSGINNSVYDNPDLLLPWLVEHAESLPNLITRFYKNMTTNIDILNLVTRQTRKMSFFGVEYDASLNFVMDMMAMAIRNIAVNIPSYFNNLSCLNEQNLIDSIDNMKTEIRNSNIGFFQFEKIENYSGICQSSELLLLLENIEMTAKLCDDFITNFQHYSEKRVNSLSKLLYFSMILFPICYIVIFGVLLCILCVSIKKEFNFRLTLFLSLPETVASEIYNSGGSAMLKNTLNKDDKVQTKSTAELQNPDQILQKEKELKIESLYQFSMKNNLITGTGLKEYLITIILFIIISALSMFFLTYYSRSVNETFLSRSYMLCSSALRYSSTSYASMFVEECFVTSCLSIFNRSEINRLSELFLERSESFHQSLIYGDKNIKFDFHEYKSIEDLVLARVQSRNIDEITVRHSHALLQHQGYLYDSIDTFMSLFIESSYGIISTFDKDLNYYKLNGSTWKNYNHLIVSHLRSDLELATYYYITGISGVIDNSFVFALVFSVVVIIVLVLILIGPLTSSAISICSYLNTAIHALCQVPPDVFNRCFYINKWLKGQISRSNFHQFENTFKRNISNELKEKIFQRSDEKVLAFSVAGEFIDINCFDFEEMKEKSLTNILPIIIENIKQNELDEAQRIFDRFKETKDQIENKVIICKSKNRSIQLTFTGIPSEKVSTSFQRFYEYIIVLVKDVTKETKIEDIYNAEKQKTIALYNHVIPPQLTLRIHDGENNISFASTIGSVLSIKLNNYNECLEKINLSETAKILAEFRKSVFSCLAEIDNVSLISMYCNEFLFSAGFFNEEQNGRTEAIDTIHFLANLFAAFSEIIDHYNLMINFKVGIATGGPIFCKIIDEDDFTPFISGETVSIAKILRDMSSPGQILIEKTTFECIYGVNVNPQQIGEFEFQGKQNIYYSIDIDKNTQILTDL